MFKFFKYSTFIYTTLMLTVAVIVGNSMNNQLSSAFVTMVISIIIAIPFMLYWNSRLENNK